MLEEIACSHSARQRLSSHSTGPEYDPSTPTTSNALFLQTQSKLVFLNHFFGLFSWEGEGEKEEGGVLLELGWSGEEMESAIYKKCSVMCVEVESVVTSAHVQTHATSHLH